MKIVPMGYIPCKSEFEFIHEWEDPIIKGNVNKFYIKFIFRSKGTCYSQDSCTSSLWDMIVDEYHSFTAVSTGSIIWN